MLSRNVKNKKCTSKLAFYIGKKIEKDSDDFWYRKLTLKVKFWHFLIPPHNSIISFWCSDFLGKNLSNFVPLPWKLDNPYYNRRHTKYSFKFRSFEFWLSTRWFQLWRLKSWFYWLQLFLWFWLYIQTMAMEKLLEEWKPQNVTQCPRTDLNKSFLPRPKTITTKTALQ